MSATNELVAVAWGEVRPHQGYVQKQKKDPPGSRQVKWTLQTGSCLTSLWGLVVGGVFEWDTHLTK